MIADYPDCRHAGALVLLLTGEERESLEHVGRGRVPRRYRVVEELLRPDHQGLAVRAGLEESAALAVPEQPEQLVGKPSGLLEPPELERRLVQRQARFGHQRVIVRVARSSGLAVPP